jgi:hypothetical protein
VAWEEERELVPTDAEGLAVLAQAGGHLGEHAVALRMPEAVVELLEIVDVEDADGQRHALLLGLRQVVLEPLVEVPVVAEPGEGVGERESHGGELAEDRALVERDRGERAEERRGEEGRALPQHGEHERERGHDRERDERRRDRPREER